MAANKVYGGIAYNTLTKDITCYRMDGSGKLVIHGVEQIEYDVLTHDTVKVVEIYNIIYCTEDGVKNYFKNKSSDFVIM